MVKDRQVVLYNHWYEIVVEFPIGDASITRGATIDQAKLIFMNTSIAI